MKSLMAAMVMIASLSLMFLLFPSDSPAAEKNFIVSFGTGGMSTYKVVDNTCFVYTLGYPKEEKQISQLMNNVLTDSIGQAKKQFAKENDGLVNVKVFWQFLGKERIIYQVCGDVVKKGGY
ncbi:MAG: hypothetical protein A4E57_00216 [Syntrophorhabdaceae bacterium PtaU1.Bin034]|jgi:hypothetical protein|nr:MAG: hypothetical protein A4E57_00216 [Syntrophorhabdaceae bacterium PtaU1.Bin034]